MTLTHVTITTTATQVYRGPSALPNDLAWMLVVRHYA